MKTLKLLLVFTIVLFSCNGPETKEVVDISYIKDTVDKIINKWHQDASEANFDSYFSAIDSIAVIIGTDPTEYWTTEQYKDFCKRHFDKGKAWDFKPLERNIYVSKRADVVWFDELLDTWMGPCRGSGVLEKNNGEWKIKHYIFSVTVPNDNIYDVIDIKAEWDSVFINSKFNK